jgi:acyl-CoA synthetase (AMP-forming)/AMP-acid ligase II
MIVAGVAAQGLVSAETLKQFLLARLPAWQVPREWWFVDVLAANARGKFSRAEWRKKFVEDRPRANVNRGIRVPGPNDF